MAEWLDGWMAEWLDGWMAGLPLVYRSFQTTETRELSYVFALFLFIPRLFQLRHQLKKFYSW